MSKYAAYNVLIVIYISSNADLDFVIILKKISRTKVMLFYN